MGSRLRSVWLALVAAPALALAVPALAQGYAGGGAGSGGAAAGQRVSTARGVLRGTVTGVNYQGGVVGLVSGARRYLLRGTPSQVAAYRPGEVASIPFAAWGNALWINRGGNAQASGNFSQQITVGGTVVGLSKPAGVVAVRRGERVLQLRANPNTIQQLVPGEFVSLTYRLVGQVPWVSTVRAGAKR